MRRSILNDDRSTVLVWGSKRKRSHSSMIQDGDNQEEGPNGCSQFTGYGVIQQADNQNNTTNRVESTFMIVYFVNNQFYCCFYDPSLCEIQFFDPIQNSNQENKNILTLIHQFNPETLICNAKVKHKLDFQKELNIKVDSKSSKDFSFNVGDLFLGDLLNELNTREETTEVSNLKDFICRLNILDNYKYYCCLVSAFQLELEALNIGQDKSKKSDFIKILKFSNIDGFMTLDLESMVSLDIISLDKENKSKSTVVDLFGKTDSKIGNSMLVSYLMRPLFDINKIQQRLFAVDCIINEMELNRKNSLISQISDSIRGLSDISKVINDLKIGDYKASVWKKLRNYVINIIKIKEYSESSSKLMECKLFADFCGCFSIDEVYNIRFKLERVLDFDTEIDSVNIRTGIDQEFEDFRNSYDEIEQILNDISTELSKTSRLDIVTAYIPQFGYLIAIDINDNDSLNLYPEYDQVFQTSTTRYYKNDDMLQMDEKFGDLYSLIRDKEIEILYKLKNDIIEDIDILIRTYSFIGHIDVMICFAKVSLENKFCKPEIKQDNGNPVIRVVGSFHPLIKRNEFISNDFNFNKNRVIVITGPNYSGKSTLLTQVGLTVYLAQIGCFIPAVSGTLSIFKTILTRVNTMDSINTTQSTFMKDCQQMSNCLYKSCNKSLVLIDEFGKGTDVNDGPGLLGGVINAYLRKGDESPIVIITTHISELFEDGLIGIPADIQFNHMKVIIEESQSFSITFLYELASGIEYSSCGLYCASKCGIEIDVIEKAQFILEFIEQGKDIVSEFSQLDEKEMGIIEDSENCIKKFLELDFQEWADQDVSKLRSEMSKILK